MGTKVKQGEGVSGLPLLPHPTLLPSLLPCVLLRCLLFLSTPTALILTSAQGATQLPLPTRSPIREPEDPSHSLAHQLLPRPPCGWSPPSTAK